MEQQTKAGDTVQATGIITRALSGFYTLRTPDGELVCRGRGVLRKRGLTPMVGDIATAVDNGDGSVTLMELLPRRNCLVRPPVANLDRLVLVVSCAQPAPNLQVIDMLTAIAAHRSIPVELVFSKIDLCSPDGIDDLYRNAGYPVYTVNSLSGEGAEQLRSAFSTGLSVFCGNSGAGKSSLLNALYPELSLETAQISKKLGRGRHTTRHIELFDTGCGGFIADTPGFSAVEFLQWERMSAGELEDCFPEFEQLVGLCRYTGCSHTSERGCAVIEAVQRGAVAESRWHSYCAIYNELKQVKEWER